MWFSFTAADYFTYSFGDLDPECSEHIDALFTFAEIYASAPEGFVLRNDRPEVLRAGILGRYPPIKTASELVSTLSSDSDSPSRLFRSKINQTIKDAQAQDNILHLLNEEQREFVSYVLRNYQNEGVDELDVSKLSNVLTAKYGSLHAAQQTLGSIKRYKRHSLISEASVRGSILGLLRNL